MTAVYKNTQTNEIYQLGGISNIGKAWKLSKMVCNRMDWNEEMFAQDVIVTLK